MVYPSGSRCFLQLITPGPRAHTSWMILVRAFLILFLASVRADDLRVGTASVDLRAEDSMVIAGGITAGKASGQEGRLRCIANVLEKDRTRLAIVACDVLMMTRQTLDPVTAEIERTTGISITNILIN